MTTRPLISFIVRFNTIVYMQVYKETTTLLFLIDPSHRILREQNDFFVARGIHSYKEFPKIIIVFHAIANPSIHPFFSFLMPSFGVFVAAFQAHCLVKKVDMLRCTIEKSPAILCILSVSRRKRRRNNTPLRFSPGLYLYLCLCFRLTVGVGEPVYQSFYLSSFRCRFLVDNIPQAAFSSSPRVVRT